MKARLVGNQGGQVRHFYRRGPEVAERLNVIREAPSHLSCGDAMKPSKARNDKLLEVIYDPLVLVGVIGVGVDMPNSSGEATPSDTHSKARACALFTRVSVSEPCAYYAVPEHRPQGLSRHAGGPSYRRVQSFGEKLCLAGHGVGALRGSGGKPFKGGGTKDVHLDVNLTKSSINYVGAGDLSQLSERFQSKASQKAHGRMPYSRSDYFSSGFNYFGRGHVAHGVPSEVASELGRGLARSVYRFERSLDDLAGRFECLAGCDSGVVAKSLCGPSRPSGKGSRLGGGLRGGHRGKPSGGSRCGHAAGHYYLRDIKDGVRKCVGELRVHQLVEHLLVSFGKELADDGTLTLHVFVGLVVVLAGLVEVPHLRVNVPVINARYPHHPALQLEERTARVFGLGKDAIHIPEALCGRLYCAGRKLIRPKRCVGKASQLFGHLA